MSLQQWRANGWLRDHKTDSQRLASNGRQMPITLMPVERSVIMSSMIM